jgi:TonB family protein
MGLAGLLVTATAIIAQDSQVYQSGNGVSTPRLIKEVKPNYTKEARDAKIQGTVVLAVVVREDGTVGDAQVTRSLDAKYGLDNEAIKSAKQWTFSPGLKDDKPVAVKVTVEIAFTLR